MGTTMHFTTPMMKLQDSTQTKVLLVTLAETPPVEPIGIPALEALLTTPAAKKD